MKQKWLLWMTTIMLFVGIIAPANQVMVTAESNKKVYTVGTSGQTKPLDYFNENNELVGVEIDILKEIENRLEDVTFKYDITEFASLFAGLDSGQFDLVCNNLGENAERREKFLFSLYPYVVTHNVIITQTEAPDNVTVGDLAGKTFGVVAASPQSMFLEKWNESHPDQKVIIKYVESDPSNIIRDVYYGRLDATIYSTTYVNDVQKNYGIQLKTHPIENEDAIRLPGSYYIFRKDNLELRQRMDEVLAEMRADGTLAAISQKYLDQDDTQLSQAVIDRNDQFESKRIEESQQSESANTSAVNSQVSDGKIFVPQQIIRMLPELLKKLPITLLMTVVSAIIGIGLGFVIALIKLNNVPILTPIANIFVSFMRGTPQLVQLFLSYYGLPVIVQWINQAWGTQWDINGIPALLYVFLAFGLNEAAYNSETIRSAILSVNPNEIEAAKSIGLTDRQTMIRIILPSAMIVALPNLGNSFISLLKGTSLAFTVTVIDIMGQARIMAGSNLRFFEAYIAVSLIYWVLCIVFARAIRMWESHLNVNMD